MEKVIEKTISTIPLSIVLSSFTQSQAVQQIDKLITERLLNIQLHSRFIIFRSGPSTILADGVTKKRIGEFKDIADVFNYLNSNNLLNNVYIHIKDGEYITDPIAIYAPNYCIIEGEGPSTIIKLRGGYPTSNLIIGAPQHSIIKDLVLDWNSPGQGPSSNWGTEARNLNIRGSNFCIIERIIFRNGPYLSLQWVQGENNIIRNCVVENGGQLQIGASASYLKNFIVEGNILTTGAGWSSGQSDNIIYIGNIISGDFLIRPYSAYSTQTGIRNCIIAFNQINGLLWLNGNAYSPRPSFENILIFGNVMKELRINETQNALDPTKHILIMGNIITGPGNGIFLSYTTKLKVIANIIRQSAGILEQNSDYNYYLLNDVSDTQNKITLSGLNSKKQLNIGDDI